MKSILQLTPSDFRGMRCLLADYIDASRDIACIGADYRTGALSRSWEQKQPWQLGSTHIWSMCVGEVIMRLMSIIVLLLVLLPSQAEADVPIQNILKSKPEEVVIALMNFDFTGGYREAPETYSVWFPLTTNGSPDSGTSYSACQKTAPFIRSYRVYETEFVAPGKAHVWVEVEVSGLYASRDALNNIDKCYWPELGLTIRDSVSGEEIELAHPMSASNFIRIAAKKLTDDLFNEYQNHESHVVAIAKERRIWRYHVPLVLVNGNWLILSEMLPPAMPSVQVEMQRQEETIARHQLNTKICAGLHRPNHSDPEYYRQFICPPNNFPERQLSHSRKNLEVLQNIQRGN